MVTLNISRIIVGLNQFSSDLLSLICKKTDWTDARSTPSSLFLCSKNNKKHDIYLFTADTVNVLIKKGSTEEKSEK